MTKHKRRKPDNNADQQEIVRLLTVSNVKIALFKQGFKYFMSLETLCNDYPEIIPLNSRAAGNIRAALSKAKYNLKIEVTPCQE
jgi:hypothetical protein